MAVQRIRVTYGRSGPLTYISHLDMMRMWQRAFRRGGVPVAYSTGQFHRPRFSLGAPLPVGVTADGELMDVYMKRRMSPFYFLKQVGQQLPQGVEINEAQDVPLDWPSLQSQVLKAEYAVVVTMHGDAGVESIEEAIREFVERESLPWEHQRDQEIRRYDLRAQVHDLWVEGGAEGEATLGMLLKCDPAGSGRPEQVVAALGLPLPPRAIHRKRLLLADLPKKAPARRR